ncbi:unnamed protein product [Cuscuta epithymum]|uniref:SHSP domain-containing protein n=1 Tax=Cuscuta epithymum TaxID=186058 RepID=A0AAV0ED97_9ASTE|nr:unnamed protein product [Cuscuta epithymum]
MEMIKRRDPPIYVSNPIYENVSGADADTLIIYLPGLNKEHIKLQLTQKGNMRIQVDPHNNKKWISLQKVFTLPLDCDTKNIKAKLGFDILYIIQPTTAAGNEEEEEDEEEEEIKSGISVATKLMLRSTKTLCNVTLVALMIVGIGLYVNTMIRSFRETN